MSKFFEKKNPNASIASVASSMSIAAIIMIVVGFLRDSFNRHGVIAYSLVITFAVLLVGAITWQVAPFGSQKKSENDDSSIECP